MKTRSVVVLFVAVSLVAVSFVPLATPVAATGPGRSIVRIRSGVNGWNAIHSVCALLGCHVDRSLDSLPGETAPSSLFLVRNLPPLTPIISGQLAALGVAAIEADLPVAVASEEAWLSNQATAGVLDQLWNRIPVTYYGSTAWHSYLAQPASGIIRVLEAHCVLRATGGTIVAVIDTGVDLEHPTLAPFLVSGYDFTRDVEGGSERADVDQATAGVLDGIYGVNSGTAAVLDQATAGVLDDDSTHSSFGHGTMAAGVVHLVAPTAQIMPLKAFAADGSGYTSDILRAIYYAGRTGARVLNMSFSRSTPSDELRRAIDWAASLGVIAVASAGNNGEAALRYPAAYPQVMAVASTSNEDVRSSFSNYGSNFVWVAAPGEAIITTYPWGSFAAAWGTSFSTPMVAGAAALLVGMEGSANFDQVSSAVAQAVPLTAELGHGRLDLYQAVAYGRSLWPNAPLSPVPDTCESLSSDWSEVPSDPPPLPPQSDPSPSPPPSDPPPSDPPPSPPPSDPPPSPPPSDPPPSPAP
jgi:subtilase family protein